MSYFTESFDEKVVELLNGGGVGFMPSDTVYGLSARALDKVAVEKIYHLKQRDDGKPCIVLLSSVDQATQLMIDPKDLEPVATYWPAPLTLIAPAENSPEYLHRGLESLAVRVPDSEDLRGLIAITGPLVSTSANIQDQPIARTPQQAQEVFGDYLDFYIDAGELSGEPSTVLKFADGRLQIVRPGAWQMPPQPL